MIKVKLYEEIIETKLSVVRCNKSNLKSKLTSIINDRGDINDDLIVKITKRDCIIYLKNNLGIATITLEPAARVRIETDFNKLESDFVRIDDALIKQGINKFKEKYCYIRKINLDEDFIIMDVYVAMNE